MKLFYRISLWTALSMIAAMDADGQQEVRHGPDSTFLLSGKVLRRADSLSIPNTHVLNLSRGTGTITNAEGRFMLTVGDNDTLKFSCIGFKEHHMNINSMLLRSSVMVFLQTDTVMMDELRVTPLPPRRFFKYVFLETRVPDEKLPELNLLPMIGNDPGNVPQSGIIIKGPAQMLYDAFNKKARLQRKLKRNREKYLPYLMPEEQDKTP